MLPPDLRSTASLHHPPPAEEDAESAVKSKLAPAVAELRLRSVLGDRFELIRLVGAGSFGDVYEARDHRHPHSTVALKLLRRHEPSALYRFKREFRDLADVSHPNLVALHELFLIDEYHAFFTMELVRGGDLLSYVRPEGVLDEPRLRAALQGLTAGVRALHAFGRLHRDLKPGNVLVDGAGRVVIVDFGLATALGEQDNSVPCVFAGTPVYAAPEQLFVGGSIGEESDWYAVGTMLYEALSARPPFVGPFAQLATAKLESPEPLPPLPVSLAPLGALCMRLLHPDARARAGAAELCDALGETGTTAASVATFPARRDHAFVGRRAELALLDESLSRVERGAFACSVVLAASGMGKTALVERFLDQLRAAGRALVLRGRCYVNEHVPYRAIDGIIDALSHRLLELPPAEVAALAQPDARVLAQLFPALMRVAAFSSPASAAPIADRAAVRELGVRALRQLFAALAELLPLVLFIDDLQWDDADSAWLISALLADPPPPSLLLIAACRDDEKERSHVLRVLARDPSLALATRELELTGLGRDEIMTLASSALGGAEDDLVLTAIASESAGHPMFAIELGRWAAGSDTRERVAQALSLEEAIRDRAETLTASARQLLELTCAAGHRLTLRTAAHICGDDPLALRELVTRKLLTVTGTRPDDTLEPYHDRVREALLQGMESEPVRALRGQLADSLAEDEAPRFDLIVGHYLAAGLPAKAARYALEAADRAANVLAFYRIPALIELAIAHAEPSQRVQLYARLGQAYALVSRTRDAARSFQAAAELEPDAGRRWELRRSAMWQTLHGGELAGGLSLLRELDQPFGHFGVRPRWWSFLFNIGLFLFWGVFGPPKLRTQDSRDPWRARDEKKLRLAWSATTGLVYAHTGLAVHTLVTAFRLAARLGDVSVYAAILAGSAATLAARAGRPRAKADAVIERAIELARTDDDREALQTVAMTQAVYLLYTAQPERAERVLNSVLEAPFSPRTEAGTLVKAGAWQLASAVFFWRGKLQRTREHAGAWIREAREHAGAYLEQGLTALSAHRFLCDDDVDQALAEWSRVHAQSPEHSAFNDPIWGAIIGLYASRLDVADRALAQSRRAFWRWNAYVSMGRTIYLWTRGAVAAARSAASSSSRHTRWLLSSSIWALGLERTAIAAPMQGHLLAARAFARGQHATGVAHLERAQEAYAAHGYRLFAACASHALSALHPDERVRSAHAARAREVFEAEGLRRPERWVRALLAGLPDSCSTP